MGYYPVFLQLNGRRCLVVGGGKVAEGKVRGLLDAGADVTVVAPRLTESLHALFQAGRLHYTPRDYRAEDLDGQDLCFVATDDGLVNSQVAADCRRRGVWVNAADDPVNCDFILPSVVRRGEVVVAASTGGASPALARRLREELTAFLDEDYEPLAELLRDVRSEVRSRGLNVDPETWQKALDARLRALVAQRRLEEARVYLLEGLGVGAAAPEA
ncbi:MAG TPA: bifunctional precorrin-2 dehydrogenase/sirohydrochlorin ferrochelatase [Dehalococcoidia bacterium]|nr:bifunctional precorrin-2 dehydrogenase/sirohydrochlorin ferrochelatase [Dehalococcoidia bacterium]